MLEQNRVYLPPSEMENAVEPFPMESGRSLDGTGREGENQLESLYQEALAALRKRERERARTLLVRVVALDPDYKEATRYLHLAVTGA
ncbi:MAG: hypothetical protein ACPGWR_32050, partial [Ardenticatenaceae bacterium]